MLAILNGDFRARAAGPSARKSRGSAQVSHYPTILSRTESSQPWQLEGGPPEIDTGDGAENVDLDSFYPSHHQSRISPDIDPNSAPGGCHPDPPALDREILADCRRWQHDGDLGNGAHHRRYEGVRIRSWPNAIVADFLECVTANRLPKSSGSFVRPPLRPRRRSRAACAQTSVRPARSGRSRSAPPTLYNRNGCRLERWPPSRRSSYELQ